MVAVAVRKILELAQAIELVCSIKFKKNTNFSTLAFSLLDGIVSWDECTTEER